MWEVQENGFKNKRLTRFHNREIKRMEYEFLWMERYMQNQKQAVAFRSLESIGHLCGCLSVLVWMRQNEEINVFDRVSQIFG